MPNVALWIDFPELRKNFKDTANWKISEIDKPAKTSKDR
jgi:hypothetical protein